MLQRLRNGTATLTGGRSSCGHEREKGRGLLQPERVKRWLRHFLFPHLALVTW